MHKAASISLLAATLLLFHLAVSASGADTPSDKTGKSHLPKAERKNRGQAAPAKQGYTPYRPSERIRADQAVAFPVDI